MNALADFRQEEARRAGQQVAVNALVETSIVEAEALARRFATEAHAQYAQYAGYWDSWEFGVVRRRVKTKGGVRFEAGDFVLFSRREYDGGEDGEFSTAYSVRGEVNCSIRHRDVGVVGWPGFVRR